MRNSILFLSLSTTLFFCQLSAQGQDVEKRRLMRNINVPLKSHIFPSVTGDDRFMLFYSDYSNTSRFELKYSEKTGPDFWEEAKYVENLTKHHNDHFGSYCISYDGRYLYFSSHRANGIGKYDIWVSERRGNAWSTPVNPGKPLNSPENDGNPCLSPDGRSLYFMRCQTMDANNKDGCKIYVSRKVSANRWGEPEELPAHVNAYSSTTPRILIDNETLVYSSERPGGKGKLDLYMTRHVNGRWTEPIPLYFINSPRNDEFVSVPARGDIIYYTDVYKDQHNIFMALLPQEFRPKKVMLVTGKVYYTDTDQVPTDLSIQAFDAKTGTLVTSVKPDEKDGNFFISLAEGKTYDFSVFPLNADHTYYAEHFDLTEMQNPKWEQLEIPLMPLRKGTKIDIQTIDFDDYNTIKEHASTEFRRLTALMQKNPGLNMEVGVYVDQVITDTLPRPGLNKLITDTSFITLSKIDLFENGESFGVSQEDSLASMGYYFLTETDDQTVYYKVKKTYSNDDTQEKAEAIVSALISRGTPSHRLRAVSLPPRKATNYQASPQDYVSIYGVEVRLF